jgi:hypothetical protein
MPDGGRHIKSICRRVPPLRAIGRLFYSALFFFSSASIAAI